ncbi:MAG: AraC family transcriptional regulator, partial [Pseudomonas alloputida]
MPRSHAALWRDPALAHVESRRACDSRACYKAHS